MQEALLRLHAAEGVENREAFLTTVTTRLAIDVLRSARVRRETYVGEWLPEPLVEDAGLPAGRGRGDGLARVPRAARAPQARRARGVRPARLLRLLVRRDRRRSWASPRTTAARSSAAPAAASPRSGRASTPTPSSATRSPRASSPPRARATSRASSPCSPPDAVLIGDGGGKARAIPRPMVGAEAIARAFGAFARMADELGVTLRAGARQRPAGRAARSRPTAASSTSSRSTSPTARSQRIHSMLNPDKLGHLGPLSDVGLRPSVR